MIKIKSIINTSLFGKIICGAIGSFIGAIAVYYAIYCFFERPKKEVTKAVYMARIKHAEYLVVKNMLKDALYEYDVLLKEVSVAEYPELYALIKNNEGDCYLKLAKKSNKKENLKKAIQSFQVVREIYSVKEYLFNYNVVDYFETLDNLGTAYGILAEVLDRDEEKEEELFRAIKAFKKAREIHYVRVQLPFIYAETTDKLGIAYEMLAEVGYDGEKLKEAMKMHEEAQKIRIEYFREW